MNKYLWAESNDHFITQIDPNLHIRDFVDYDSNLLAVAFNIPWANRSQSVINRVDSGSCVAPSTSKPRYVSEIYYNASNCYNGNTGDSATAMGRIGWADGHARKAVGDLSFYNEKIMAPVITDLFKNIWLTERYTCTGQLIRTPYYLEFPEMLTMLTREVSYGIDVGINTITLSPFARTTFFNYVVQNLNITYSQQKVIFATLPGSGSKGFTITGLSPSTSYSINNNDKVQVVSTNGNGALYFNAIIGEGFTTVVTQL